MPYAAIGGQVAGQIPLIVASKVTLDVTKAAFNNPMTPKRRKGKTSRRRRSALGGTSPF